MTCAQCGRPLFDFEQKDGVCMTCPLMVALGLRDRAELARYGAQRWDRRYIRLELGAEVIAKISKNAKENGDRSRAAYVPVRRVREHNGL